MPFPLSFCLSPNPADWNIHVMASAPVTFLDHEGTSYNVPGMAASACLKTSCHWAASCLGHPPPGFRWDNTPAFVFRLQVEVMWWFEVPCCGTASNCGVRVLWASGKPRRGTGPRTALEIKGWTAAVNCVQTVYAVDMLNTVSFAQCWDLGLEFIIVSLWFFFLPLVFKIHWYSLTLFLQTCLLHAASPPPSLWSKAYKSTFGLFIAVNSFQVNIKRNPLTKLSFLWNLHLMHGIFPDEW